MSVFLTERAQIISGGLGEGGQGERWEREREIFYRDATSLNSTWERWQVKGQIKKRCKTRKRRDMV